MVDLQRIEDMRKYRRLMTSSHLNPEDSHKRREWRYWQAYCLQNYGVDEVDRAEQEVRRLTQAVNQPISPV